MKYILSFLMMFFIGLTAMSISSYAYDVISVYYADSEQASIIKENWSDSLGLYPPTTNMYNDRPTGAVGYVDFILASASDFNQLPKSQQYCIRFWFQDTNSHTITIENDSNNLYYRFVADAPKYYYIWGFINSRWNVTSREAGYYYGINLQSNYFNSNNRDVIVIDTNLESVTFTGEKEPSVTLQGDTFFVTKENYTCNFGVFCGPGSELVTPSGDTDLASNYYRTKKYTVNVEFEYQNSTVTYTIPNYLNWLYKYNVYIDKEFDDTSNVLSQIIEFIKAFTFYAEPVYNNTMQAIRCPVVNEPIISTPIWSFDDMTDYRSFNQITLSQLLGSLVSTYPNMTINDLYTELTFKFYDESGKLCYEGVNDYSSLYNSGVEPEPDPYVTDLTKATEELNQYLISNNKYLQNIMYGDTYNAMPYETAIKDAGNVNLDLISVPDYSYTKHNLDTGATSFFGRMVEWWYLDTPFGIIATVALTLLVIRVILW